jgi:hypothetical protein
MNHRLMQKTSLVIDFAYTIQVMESLFLTAALLHVTARSWHQSREAFLLAPSDQTVLACPFFE